MVRDGEHFFMSHNDLNTTDNNKGLRDSLNQLSCLMSAQEFEIFDFAISFYLKKNF
jgi:hypothetical protein